MHCVQLSSAASRQSRLDFSVLFFAVVQWHWAQTGFVAWHKVQGPIVFKVRVDADCVQWRWIGLRMDL